MKGGICSMNEKLYSRKADDDRYMEVVLFT